MGMDAAASSGSVDNGTGSVNVQPAAATKKKHANQWTYRKKDPNKPHPNQYTYRPKSGSATNGAASSSSSSRPPLKKRKTAKKAKTVTVTAATAAEPARSESGGDDSAAEDDVPHTQTGKSASGGATSGRRRSSTPVDYNSETEILLDDKLYCICKTLYDEERMMIACDNCDEWYHTACMNMSDAKAELVDMFVCPACETLTAERTTYKAKCLYASCTHAALRPLSQFCSEKCGIAHAGAKIARGRFGRSNPLAAAAALGYDPDVRPSMFGGGGVEKLLASREVQSGKKREGMVVWADGGEDLLADGWLARDECPDPGQALLSQMADVRHRRAEAHRAQRILQARHQFLHLVISRAESIPAVKPGEAAHDAGNAADASETPPPQGGTGATPQPDPLFRNKNKKRKGADEVIEALVSKSWMRCGFDERLVWPESRFAKWMESELGQKIMSKEQEIDGTLVDDGLDYLSRCISRLRTGTDDAIGVEEPPAGVCGLAKRKCKRHVDWPAVRESEINAEMEEQSRFLQQLAEEEDSIQLRLEAQDQSTQAERIIAAASDASLAAALARAGRRPLPNPTA
ncbi:COMPASS (complex proteins associated with Set1p) component [Tilletia horrida]|uniref:COMPASS (Complex proteins associated with Set1p) component n=1 Tax=Tilletia horrida TaxID=155126 RepID=A0AAN6GPX0_9BASI|nr:COMPASS (complex proteins associated with Set1p) component [Tilletia horrida]KAK0563417.1 COMPASS (complex proteins associated with Set1p) component [Tilletia horrida]